jgi:hypothetical protein
MAQFYINPENYTDEEIAEIKQFCLVEAKIETLLGTLEAIQVLSESKFDLEDKIVTKLDRLINTL